MGVDLIAITLEAGREFDVELPHAGEFLASVPTPQGLPNDSHLTDATAQQLFDWICQEIRAQRGAVPVDAWSRYCKCVANVLYVETAEIKPDYWLGRDLGLS